MAATPDVPDRGLYSKLIGSADIADIGSIEASRVIAGRYRWWEQLLFALLGGWAGEESDASVKTRLRVDSYHHGWHAQLWEERLGSLGEPDPDGATCPPAGLEDFTSLLGEPHRHPAVRLVGVYRVVLPRMVTTYSDHLRLIGEDVASGPVARALKLVLADELDHWRTGEALMQRLLGDPETAKQASERQGELEARLISV